MDDPKIEYLYATVFILAGFIFYVPFVYYQKVLPGMSKFQSRLSPHTYSHFTSFLSILGYVTTFFQLLLEVAPSTAVAED